MNNYYNEHPNYVEDIAIMKATLKSVDTAVGNLVENFTKTRDIVNKHTIVVGNLQRIVENDLLPSIKKIPETIDGKITYHEENDPLHSAAKAAQKKSITKQLAQTSKDSIPPEHTVTNGRYKMKSRLIQTIIGFLIAATSVLTTWAATH